MRGAPAARRRAAGAGRLRPHRYGARRRAWRPRWPRLPQLSRTRVLVALLVAAGLAATGAWALVGSDWLQVRAVAVTGTARLRPVDVRAAAAVPLGAPLALADVDGARRRVAALPIVAGVEVRRAWPSTLRIDVRERRPLVAVPSDGGVVLLDAAGVAFATDPRPPRGAVLLRAPAPSAADPATRAGLEVVAALSPPVRDRVAEVAVPSPDAITLSLRNGATVVWGSPTAASRKAQILDVLLQRRARTYDVSTPDVVTTSS